MKADNKVECGIGSKCETCVLQTLNPSEVVGIGICTFPDHTRCTFMLVNVQASSNSKITVRPPITT